MEKKIVCQNRKARHDYFIDEIYEAGIVLIGPEVKSLREGSASLKDTYARVKNGELFLHNMHITPYPFAHNLNLNPIRTRKLLMQKREIKRLIGKTEEKGYSLIPLSIYLLRGIIKVELALAKGKRKYDKRYVLKEREMKRELDQLKKKDRH
ncbi:MAG: SsrA-binding protein SmpB [Desulfobacteraceae bacterium]|jgi:SsrA-binding protein|nr:MAG: SsrA-binding protein SmpB [Desulfobacteraceae bacterium]